MDITLFKMAYDYRDFPDWFAVYLATCRSGCLLWFHSRDYRFLASYVQMGCASLLSNSLGRIPTWHAYACTTVPDPLWIGYIRH